MYHTLSAVIAPYTTIERTVQKVLPNQRAFSGCSGGVVTHGKMCDLPTKIVSSSITNATGSHATKPSMNRMTGRDQRAVVMRCTAANITPADESDVKNSQLTCHACHARS